MTPIFRWNGEYFGFINKGSLFNSSNEYVGWIVEGKVWAAKGEFRLFGISSGKHKSNAEVMQTSESLQGQGKYAETNVQHWIDHNNDA